MSKPPSAQDATILDSLIRSRAEISSTILSEKISTSPRGSGLRRQGLAEEYVMIAHSSIFEKYGWRQVEILISTLGGRTLAVGKELLKHKEVAYVARTIGKSTIDLRVEVFVRSGGELHRLVEEVKAMKGVRDIVWTEVVDVVGRKHQMSRETFMALKRKEVIKPLE